MEAVLNSLTNARWHVAARTFGSFHHTLVGILVDWWVSSGSGHEAIDEAPKCNSTSLEKCDVMLLQNGTSVGVVEVEATRHESTLAKIALCFASEFSDMRDLRLGIFLDYASPDKTVGLESLKAQAVAITALHHDKSLVLLRVNRVRESGVFGTRRRVSDGYALWRLDTIDGVLLRNGKQVDERVIYPCPESLQR